MNKPMRFLILVFALSLLCQAQEENKSSQPTDKMTLEKARAALAENKEQEGLKFEPLFDLPKDPEMEIIDTKLTYQKARAALAAENKEVKKLTALVTAKRRILTKMIGSYVEVMENGKMRATPIPPYTRKQYDEAKVAYEKARDQLKKMKSDDRVLFQKKSQK